MFSKKGSVVDVRLGSKYASGGFTFNLVKLIDILPVSEINHHDLKTKMKKENVSW